MRRREFVRRLAAGIGAAVAAVVAPSWPAAAARIWADSFARKNARSWGSPWFNQRYGRRWGISKRRAFYELPAADSGAAEYNPNPVLVLNHDVADIDERVLISVSNPNARFGLVARHFAYSDGYAFYLTGRKAVVSRLQSNREMVLRTKDFRVKPRTYYWLRLKMEGDNSVAFRAKVWKASAKEPPNWTIAGVHDDRDTVITRSGAFGLLFMHDDVAQKRARFTLRKFSATSPQAKRKTRPRITFTFAGRAQKNQDGTYRVRLVSKSDIPAIARFHVDTDPKMSKSRRLPAVESLPKFGMAKVWLEGVRPGETIYWRTTCISKAEARDHSPIHSLRIPAPGDEVSFGFASCTLRYPQLDSFAQAAKLNPVFFAHLGDLGYAYSFDGGGATASEKDFYQDRWTRILGRRPLTRLHQSASWLMLQDDNDYGKDKAWKETVRDFTIEAWDEISGNASDRRFEIRYGDAHCFFTDTRMFADDPQERDTQTHSILGIDQKQWLKEEMGKSDAELLVVFFSRPLWGPRLGEQGWKQGFENERRE
ncbi:MAG: alkaline phosphatase D family protein, partial [Actinobacteria bacterium]|nr:alkaline phosphatase D family protein [Actinomycetota bacterium]